MPLYETYAAGDESPPAFGGELSAAIQAAETDDVVGIDGPSPGFVRELGNWLVRERAESRGRHMADRLATARARGDVVAVVGAGHFDPLCDHFEE